MTMESKLRIAVDNCRPFDNNRLREIESQIKRVVKIIMKIIVDAMGGDNAPGEIVKGALAAMNEYDADILLVGDRKRIEEIAGKNLGSRVYHTEKILTMEDEPGSVLHEKSDTSMGIALKLLKENRGSAFVSSGNTGALCVGSTSIIECVPGIKRPALGALIPFVNKTLLIDAGANLEVRPEHFKQFAIMGSIYMNKFMGRENPTVGLANIGREKNKGTSLLTETYKLLSESKMINFVGNIEGSEMPTQCSDVLLADGFVGNIILKLTEGFGGFLKHILKGISQKNILPNMTALAEGDSFPKMYSLFDPEYDAAPFFGLKYPVIKAHGNANAKNIKNAVRQAIFLLESDFTGEIERQLQEKSGIGNTM